MTIPSSYCHSLIYGGRTWLILETFSFSELRLLIPSQLSLLPELHTYMYREFLGRSCMCGAEMKSAPEKEKGMRNSPELSQVLPLYFVRDRNVLRPALQLRPACAPRRCALPVLTRAQPPALLESLLFRFLPLLHHHEVRCYCHALRRRLRRAARFNI